MSKQLVKTEDLAAVEKLLIKGDLSGLNEPQRLSYVKTICKALKISNLFQPFDYITFQGKTILYAKRACTEQLRNNRHISIEIVNRERIEGLYVVTAKAIDQRGRKDEAIGAVNIKGLLGEALANAMMKAETKAKRRVTLSICGLGLLDELEAKDVAETESREVNEAIATEVQATIAPTTARPEFEENKPVDLPPETEPEYVLKAGKYKGKVISQLTQKQVANWIQFYEKQSAHMNEVPKDVESDYQEIIRYIDEKKLKEAEGGPKGEDKRVTS